MNDDQFGVAPLEVSLEFEERVFQLDLAIEFQREPAFRIAIHRTRHGLCATKEGVDNSGLSCAGDSHQ